MRVGVIGLQHESNTFLKTPTTWADFERGALLRGEAVRAEYGETHHEVGGFFQGLQEEGITAVPILMAWALPGGVVAARTLEKLLAALLAGLKEAGELDGVLVAPHGAAVADGAPDMDGFWLRELRSRVGPVMPIVGTLDLHANLSEAMVRSTNALVAYRSNPHLDQRERGCEAARLMARLLRDEVRPTQAAAFPALAINIERQATARFPLCECFDALSDLQADRRVLSSSLLLGFPYADVREMGASVLVVTNEDPALATRLAHDFAEYLDLRRREFVGQPVEIQNAVEIAAQLPGPVCLLDMGDNVGGGAPGDSTVLLDALLKRGIQKCFVCLHDSASVQRAIEVGISGRAMFSLGGNAADSPAPAIAAAGRVRGLHDGTFCETKPRHGGRRHYDMGKTAVLDLDAGPTVMLTSERVAPFSLEQLASCNLVPRDFQVLVAKGVHAPVAAYGSVCSTLLRVNTPGPTTADLASLTYIHRRRPMFPFEQS
jgi:microcystin degradation protein MlrC